jgi:hypothetical protein
MTVFLATTLTQGMGNSLSVPNSEYKKKAHEVMGFFKNFGGKGEIRTHGTPKGTLDFESSAFDHSATFPGLPTHCNECCLVASESDPSGSLLGRERL